MFQPMYSLIPGDAVLEELGDPKRYNAKIARQLLLKILELTLNPRPQDSKAIGPGYRVDSGEYRIYYEIDDANRLINVLLVGKRGDDEIYRRLKRRFG
jgi:mRNA interferase RelE/StbE